MSKSFFVTIGAFIFIALITVGIIFLAKGYTFNIKKGTVSKTGILVVTSEPRDAAVYLDNELKGTTNTTFNFLAPGKYKLRVNKDGFTAWEKEIEIKPELVTRFDLTLFPQVPDLRRQTFSGVKNAWITPDGQRIVYQVNEPTKHGLWVMSNSDRLPFVSSDPIQIYEDLGKIDLSTAVVVLSPDSKNLLLVDTSKPQYTYYFLELDRVNQSPVIQSRETVQTELLNWHDTLVAQEKELRDRLIRSIKDIPPNESQNPDITPVLKAIDATLAEAALPNNTATPTTMPTTTRARSLSTPQPSPKSPNEPQDIIAKINFLNENSLWSPKQDKVIFKENGQSKVYNLATGRFYNLPNAQHISWFPTNLHLILINPDNKKGEIVLADFDGTNQVSIFSGTFVDNIAFPWGNGTRIMVLTNLNQAAGSEPNLYAINLR